MDAVFPFEGYGLLSLSLLLISLLFFIIHAKNLIVHAIRSKQPGRRFPPGPAPLPVLGNLQELGSLPHRSLRELSEIYGPLMYLKLGQIATIVVSSASIAEEVLKTEDKTFCSRPPLSSLRKVFYGGLDIAFTPYNAYLKYAKKICVTELLCTSRVQSFGPIREGEVGILIKTILKNSRSERGSVNNLSEMFLCLLNNITCRQVLGRRFAVEGECGRSRFHDMVTEWTDMMGHFNIGEYFPSLEWINSLSGLQGRFVKNFRSIDAFLNEVVQARMADHEEDGRYIIDALLKIQDDRQGKFRLSTEHVKAILMDLFIAGTDTGAVALEWGMSELIRNPRVMRKAQNEVRSINGVKEVVEEVDLHKLTYLKLVVKEILRLHPPAAFLLPRESRKECQINSYKILSNTKVMINVWAIQRDPRIWGPDAEDFRPERFENSMIELKGQHFELIPFGSGRRGCPGIAMGTTVVELTLANLLYAFDWSMPEGGGSEELDMDESFGIVIRRKSPLFLRAVPCMEIEATVEP